MDIKTLMCYLQSLSRIVTLTRGVKILTLSLVGVNSIKKTSSLSGSRSSFIATSKHSTRVASLNGPTVSEIVP